MKSFAARFIHSEDANNSFEECRACGEQFIFCVYGARAEAIAEALLAHLCRHRQ